MALLPKTKSLMGVYTEKALTSSWDEYLISSKDKEYQKTN